MTISNNQFLARLTDYAKASGAFAYVTNVIMKEVVFLRMM